MLLNISGEHFLVFLVLRVPWTERRSNQSILKEIRPEYSLEGLTLKLKLQDFGHLMWKLTYWKRLCQRLMAGVKGDDRGWDGWMASPAWWTWVWVSSGSWWWTGKPGVLQSMGSQRVGHDWATELKIKPLPVWVLSLWAFNLPSGPMSIEALDLKEDLEWWRSMNSVS